MSFEFFKELYTVYTAVGYLLLAHVLKYNFEDKPREIFNCLIISYIKYNFPEIVTHEIDSIEDKVKNIIIEFAKNFHSLNNSNAKNFTN